MQLQLFRIDDRLIHGQVVIGWASHLNSHTIVLCDDSISKNEWEKELYLSIVPGHLRAVVTDVKGFVSQFKDKANDWGKTIVVVGSPFVVEDVLKHDVTLKEINVGGIHFKEGRKELLPFLFLNEEEMQSFKRLLDKGIKIYCQDVPTAKPIPLEKVLTK